MTITNADFRIIDNDPNRTDNPNTMQHGAPIEGAYTVDARRGSSSRALNTQWASRPDDQKYLDLSSLRAAVYARAEHATNTMINARDIEVHTDPQDTERLGLSHPRLGEFTPTNWTFGQLCSLTGTPAGYLQRIPAQLAAINLQYGLSTYNAEVMKAYSTNQPGAPLELRAVTGAGYGRIYDYSVVDAVMRIAGNGDGQTNGWKVPGVMNWSTSQYNPNVDPTKDTTTLYASDRDIFLFLVDDRRPIEIGKLSNGDPDYVFRGFYVWNSEVGARTFGLASFYLRGICANRYLWGIEQFRELTFRHSKGAPSRFMSDAHRALRTFADSSPQRLLSGIETARTPIGDADQVNEWMSRRDFTKPEISRILARHVQEEGRPARSAWDIVQGITALARDQHHQDQRIALERRAGKLLDAIKVN